MPQLACKSLASNAECLFTKGAAFHRFRTCDEDAAPLWIPVAAATGFSRFLPINPVANSAAQRRLGLRIILWHKGVALGNKRHNEPSETDGLICGDGTGA
jgi:hypothetical protein